MKRTGATRRARVARGNTRPRSRRPRWRDPEGRGYRKQELALLLDTIHDLTSTLSTREVVGRLLDRLLVHLESEIASILLIGPDENLRIRNALGLPEEVIEHTCLRPGEGISGYVAQTGAALLVEDIEKHPRFGRRNHERYYTRSAISAPLLMNGTVIGVINVNNKRSQEVYGLDDLRLLEAIAGHAALAVGNAQRYERTLARAQRDPLTGLVNHGHLWSVLEVEIMRAQRYGRELSLAMIDIDHFKAFNDRYGHRRGDEALAGVARLMSERSRVHDTAARYGGEEFVVILPETPNAGGVVCAEKIRRSIEAESFSRAGPGELTVSVGVASFPEDAQNANDLVESADARLYRAKAQGRNRVCAAVWG